MKKRLLSLLLVLLMVVGMFPAAAFAAENDVAYVTIAVEGDLKLVRYPVKLSDVNGSGGYDLDDALSLAHNEETDMEGGYASYNDPTYGLGVSKLWGDTSMWFGYSVNGTMVGGLTAEVKAGDEIYAWVYTDQVYPNGNHDILAEFDEITASVTAGQPVEVTLDGTSVANGADVAVYKVKDNHRLGAEVETDAVFDAEGKASVTIDEAGTFVITAAAKTGSAKALVPPYCMVTVSESMASSDVIYTIGSVTGAPGETVQVPISVEHGLTEGLVWWLFTVNLDDGLELVSVSNGSATRGYDIYKNGTHLEFQTGGGTCNPMPNGELAVLNVKIAEDVAAGTYNVGMSHFNYHGQFAYEITDLTTVVNEGTVTAEAASETTALEDVQLVVPEGLTTEDGINYYGAETMNSYTFGYTTVPAGVEADAQSWTFADGSNNSGSGSGVSFKASVWGAGKGTLTLSVVAGDKTVNKTYYIHTGAAPEPETPAAPFTVTVGETVMELASKGKQSFGEGTSECDTYEVTLPAGTTAMTVSSENNMYFYTPDGSGLGLGNSKEFEVTGDVVYKINVSNVGYYYLSVKFEQTTEPEEPTLPFTVTVDGVEMTEFTLGEVTDPYEGVKPLYTVTIPEGTTEVTITWKDGNNYTMSYYDANANYFGFESGMKNSWTVAMDKNGDGAYDMLQIYNSGWGVPYWITFTSGNEDPDEPASANVVVVGNAEAWPGDLIELSIFAECVENDTNVFGRRFIPTLALPDGWTIVGAVAGEDLAETVWELYETDLYGWCLNGTAENYYGAYLPSGELMKFQIQVAADAEAGEYTVELASAKMMKDDWGAGFTDFELVGGTVIISVPEGKTKLDAPVLTADSVFAPETYIEITVPASEVEPAAIVEYAISTDGTTWSEWQTGNKFTEVEDGTKYYVRARYNPFNDTYYEASDASNVLEVTTKAFVEEPVIFTVGDVIGGHGDTVYIPVSLSHSFDGLKFSSFRFCLEDNENLTLVEATNGSDISGSWHVDYAYPDHRAVFVSVSGGLAEIPAGETVILEYKIHEDATPGTYKLGLDQEIEDVFFRYSVDGSGAYGTYIDYPVTIQVVEGTVTIQEPLTAPVLTDYTATDDTITVIAPAAVENAHIEYAISANGKTYGEWQESNVFENLTEETTYYIIARYIAGEGNENVDSYASEPLEVKTVNPAATYAVASVTAKAGETVDVAVALTHEIVKQATSFQLIPAAAEGLTLQSAKVGADLPEGWKVMLNDGVVTVYRSDAAAVPSGEVVVLTYAVSEEAEDGDYTVTLSENFKEDGNAFIAEDDSVLRVNGTVTAGKVTVKNIVLGDLNGDAVVDMKDLVSLRRYLAGWAEYNAETLNLGASDLNEDGVVNMLDAIILSRHLADWPDYKTLPYVK